MEPYTRKEMYLAKIAGEDVTIPEKPYTREEMYLAKIAENGGAGGVSSWNDLTDKPFDIVELMPETQFVYNADISGFIARTGLDLVAGRTYIVNWNGVEYIGTAELFIYDQHAMIAVGNHAFIGGTDNGLPFVVASSLYFPNDKGQILAMPLDGSTSVTVGMKSYTFYEQSSVLMLDVRGRNFVNDKTVDTLYATPEELLNAFAAGKQIFYLLEYDGFWKRYSAVTIAVSDTGSLVSFLSGSNDRVYWTYNGDGTYVPSSD